MSLVLSPPPPTSVEPVTDILHGVPITDPYRWLEDQKSPRTRRWLEEQTTYARGYLDAIPNRERIRRRVQELLTVEVITSLRKVGNRYFYMKRSPYQEQPVIMMREENSDAEVVLVDPGERANGNKTTVRIIQVSSDGNLLAYGVSTGADFSCTVEVLDVDRKQILPDRLGPASEVQLRFSPDGRGFYYSQKMVDTARPDYRAVYWHELGTKSEADLEVFVAGDDPNIHLGMLASVDGHLLGYLVTHATDSLTFALYVQDVFHKERAIKILEQLPPVFEPFFNGNLLFAVTDYKAPNLRLVNIDLSHPEQENWVNVIPESRQRIKNIVFVGNYICVFYVESASTRIEIFDRLGNRHSTVPCLPRGSAEPVWQPSENEALLYNFSSFTCPPTIFSYHIPSGEQKVWARSSVNFDPLSFEVEQVRYTSKDGTEIPMFLVALKGRRLSGSLPTFLTAYGGFGISRTPQFHIYSTFLIEQGFLFAFANVRGGGEFGEEWHHAGKRHSRQNAADDFIAAAEWLITKGYATPGKIAIGGGSNGGLLTGAAITQRPELFRVAVCVGPLLDMLRYHRFDSAHLFVDEFGTADDEDDFHYLLRYSPYHRVRDGVPYPAVILVSGDDDTCCNPMHARKMVARLQAATSSVQPILLDYSPTWGHASVQPLTRRIGALADRLAFICHELGVNV